MNFRALGLIATAVAGMTLAGEIADPDAATMFEGMHRDAVAVLLGPPHKVKRSRGLVTLIYTLRQVGEGYLPSDRERLLVVPGRGPCIAVLGPVEDEGETLTFEPPRTDERGRPLSGGPTATRSRTITLGESTRADRLPPDRGKVGRKFKLKLVLDGDRVERWSATP